MQTSSKDIPLGSTTKTHQSLTDQHKDMINILNSMIAEIRCIEVPECDADLGPIEKEIALMNSKLQDINTSLFTIDAQITRIERFIGDLMIVPMPKGTQEDEKKKEAERNLRARRKH